MTALRRTGIELFFVSFAALCLELTLIRWLPSHVRVVAYFPNLILIASFLGLGAGALIRRSGSVQLIGALLLVVGAGLTLGQVVFTASDRSEHLWLLYYDMPKDAVVINSVVLPIVTIFAIVTVTFLPIGYELAARLNVFKEAKRALIGYAIDLGGSLSGVIVFLVLAETGTGPVVWFSVALAAGFFVVRPTVFTVGAYVATALLSIWAVNRFENSDLYSPYYGIRVVRGENGSRHILTNGSLHQVALDLRHVPHGAVPDNVRETAAGYRIAVSSLRSLPRRALVLGAGTGNDVAVLLDAGVPEVHAVEIDPVILRVGIEEHPAVPYRDPRVVIHNTDARAFLERTDLRFDLIVFGTLDSMTRLSALSNVRLDNFVYTVDCLKAARARLSQEGAVALMFMAADRDMDARLFSIVATAFEAPPLLHSRHYGLFNKLFLAGPGVEHLRDNEDFRDRQLEALEGVPTPTDDWPFLYLRGPSIPTFYWAVSAFIIFFAAVLILMLSKPLRQSVLRDGSVDVEMVAFGTAFLLLETAFVTELNLLFGATWRTSGFVFAAILLAILVATLISHRKPVDPRLALGVVVVSLTCISRIPLHHIAPAGLGLKTAFATFICGIPVAAAGFAFASRFAARKDVGVAFGWNILGAVVGGLLELLSMITGLKAMFLLAAAIYAGLLLVAVRRASRIAELDVHVAAASMRSGN